MVWCFEIYEFKIFKENAWRYPLSSDVHAEVSEPSAITAECPAHFP